MTSSRLNKELLRQKKLEVRVDPTVKVTMEELQAQHDMATKVQDLVSPMNDGLRALDSYKAQLEQIEKTIKDRTPDAPQELTKALTDYKKQVDELLNSLASSEDSSDSGGASKFADTLFNFSFAVAGGNFAPTPAQREYFNELQAEFPRRMAEINKFINETVPKMNETLTKYNAPIIVQGKPIDKPR